MQTDEVSKRFHRRWFEVSEGSVQAENELPKDPIRFTFTFSAFCTIRNKNEACYCSSKLLWG